MPPAIFDCHLARPRGKGWEFLLLHRAEGRLYAGTWRQVAGKVEAGESAWQACLREVAEETGLEVARLYAVPTANAFYEWQTDTLRQIPVFLGVVGPGEPVLDGEHDAWEWLGLGNALERLPWPGQRAGLQAAHDLLAGPNAEAAPFLEIPLL